MQIKHFKKPEFATSTWSGGTTTQLFIYPAGSEYTKRNFLFRISMATTETEESDFTFLPGITRHLMVLEGNLQLNQNEKPGPTLNKFDTTVFQGDWKTKGKGKVVDFNLMLSDGAIGNISAYTIEAGENKEFIISPTINFTGLHIFKGSIKIIFEKEIIIASSGDFILISNPTGIEMLNLHSIEKSEIIFTEVHL